jgi:hypothetical protein
MALLSLYIDPRGRVALHTQGFSWLAALGLPLFALRHRLWGTLAAAALLTPWPWLVLDIAHEEAPALVSTLGVAWLLLWSAVCGRFAPRWHRRSLERRGYRRFATEEPAAPAAGHA